MSLEASTWEKSYRGAPEGTFDRHRVVFVGGTFLGNDHDISDFCKDKHSRCLDASAKAL